jgi:hypothetical protein
MRYLSCVIVSCSIIALVGGSSGCKKKVQAPPVEQVAEEPAKKKEPPPEPKKEPNYGPNAPQKRKGLVYSVRHAALRPEIQNDMKEIGTFYQIEVAGGTPPTTWAAFKACLRTAPKLVQKIEDEKEKMYIIMLKGRKLQPNEILAYEKEASSEAGFCIVRANGQVTEAFPYEELLKELGLKELDTK